MKRRKSRPIPQFPEGRLPESAKPRFLKNCRLNRRSIKCGICAKRRGKLFYTIFNGRLQVWICYDCMGQDFIPWSNVEATLEEILLERFSHNPAFNIPSCKRIKGLTDGQSHVA
jgi:hypothetical protein